VRTRVETFHEFALQVVRHSGQAVDFSQADAFAVMAAQCMTALETREPDLDLLVLDELQDMQPEWVEALFLRLKTGGHTVLLEDPEQQLYKDRVAFDVPDAVTVTSHENYRTPRTLVKLINLLRLTETQVQALSPFGGEMSDPIVYASPAEIERCTAQAVERCLQRGFALADIAVVSMCSRKHSVLQGQDQLGKWTIQRFTGQFDAGSNPVWTQGQVLVESVRRFKGQAAPAVVLTECDMVQLYPLNRRLLFVGLTRARVHLEWVISKDTATMLAGALRP